MSATLTYAVRWTQPDGRTGLGDSFPTYEQASRVVEWLSSEAWRRDPAQYRMRYSIEIVKAEL